MQYMSLDDVMGIHFALVRVFADTPDPISPSGARPGGLVESATGRPRTSLGRTEKYPSLQQKAAALLHSLITSHPFHNGNKRTALVATIAFLERNGRRFGAQDDELFDFTIAVASKSGAYADPSDEAVEKIAAWLNAHLVPERGRFSEMRLQDFLSSCKTAGCSVRGTAQSGSWVLRGPNTKSIRIAASTRKLDGNVVRSYLRKLGLSESSSGIHPDEFCEGVDPEQDRVRRFRAVLNRLAHA